MHIKTVKLIGLTGGIGCGKTTVTEEFRKIGIPCFIADIHAGTYYNDPSFLEQIQTLFGNTVFNNDGTADKRRIASIVFSNRDKLMALNALIHPRVMEDFRLWAANQTTPYAIIESAILYEYELYKHLDGIITVYLEKEERIRRLMQRDRESREVIELRMANQLTAEEKMDRADYVILNYEGNPRQRQVKTIHRMVIGENENEH